jgi:two-component system, LytTR family, response regulator
LIDFIDATQQPVKSQIMKILIVEDEKHVAKQLEEELKKIDEYIEVIGICDSVNSSIYWLQTNPLPNLIIMDIHLSDGLSFSIFKTVPFICPVIFVTTDDKYFAEAFECNSIDYLLKPITEMNLRNAIKKYKILQNHFVQNYVPLSDYLNNTDRTKSRILVRHGTEFQTVKVEDIAYFFTEHKLIFLVDRSNRKFLAEKNNLADLENELDDKSFYRANRKYIINANFLKKFTLVENGKILLELALPTHEVVTVSKENSVLFKRWITQN